MSVTNILKKLLRSPGNPQPKSNPSSNPENTFIQDIYFTANFHAKAKEWELTEEHARLCYYEGDPVKGKENMKAMRYTPRHDIMALPRFR